MNRFKVGILEMGLIVRRTIDTSVTTLICHMSYNVYSKWVGVWREPTF
jgi:hypothetical protein